MACDDDRQITVYLKNVSLCHEPVMLFCIYVKSTSIIRQVCSTFTTHRCQDGSAMRSTQLNPNRELNDSTWLAYIPPWCAGCGHSELDTKLVTEKRREYTVWACLQDQCGHAWCNTVGLAMYIASNLLHWPCTANLVLCPWPHVVPPASLLQPRVHNGCFRNDAWVAVM